MENNRLCQKEELASTLEGNISLCQCGIYHIHLNAVTLHLTGAQFIAASRLFKLAFGILVGHRECPATTLATTWKTENTCDHSGEQVMAVSTSISESLL